MITAGPLPRVLDAFPFASGQSTDLDLHGRTKSKSHPATLPTTLVVENLKK